MGIFERFRRLRINEGNFPRFLVTLLHRPRSPFHSSPERGRAIHIHLPQIVTTLAALAETLRVLAETLAAGDSHGDEDQGIWTSPDWIGNKAKSRDWIPLHPTLAGLLAQHRLTVPNGDQAPVFPIVPSRGAFRTDRQAAGLPAVTPQRRTISPHSCRASFASWLANAGVSDSIISRLMRHTGSLAERVYVVRDAAIEARELRAAILLLPPIWPEMGLRLEKKEGIFPKDPCTLRPKEYSGLSQAGPTTDTRTVPQPPHRPENLEAGSGRALGGPGSHVGEPEPPTAKIEPKVQVCGSKIPDGDLESLTRVLVRLADLWLARASGNGGSRAQPTDPSGPDPQRH